MKVEETKFRRVYIITPDVFEDKRGYLFELYNSKKYEFLRLSRFVQENQTFSIKNTIRGVHMQKQPYSQAKLVNVVKGKIMAVCVDLREKSETFGRHISLEMPEDEHKQLFVPEGIAFGFATLSEESIVLYKLSKPYHPESQIGIRFDDPNLNINWMVNEPILSDKDLKLFSFREAIKLIKEI